MYKRQMRLQKVFCLLALIASALVFVYSLGMVTDLYDALITTIPDPDFLDEAYVTGARVFYDIQPFNHQLMLAGLGLIIISLGLFITNTQSRRRYYIGNYLATGIWVAASVAVAGWAHYWVQTFKHQFQTTVDFGQLAEYAQENKTLLLTAEDTFWFDLHYLVLGFLVLMCVVMVANVFWKISLMKQEAALLAGATDKAGSAPAKTK